MQSIDGLLKSNNEIEVCEVFDPKSKQALEKELHRQRISFSIRWIKPRLFSKQKNICAFAINEHAKDMVEDIINNLPSDIQSNIKIIYRKSSKNFL